MTSPQQPSVRSGRARTELEHRSDGLATGVRRIPKPLLLIAFGLLVVGGLVLRGVLGGVLLALAAVFVAWLAYLAWPRSDRLERMMRLAVLALIVALAVVSFASEGLVF
ncbi:hypothetical protein G9U51_16770 [Calidifontibacter sp. DB0510]|uniref:Uncharacterized protein n=1 Tax=Metallococcus carri TaxID=1656884 RepID=A0A967EAF9_9MICO|nr:DUF6703 family protein [Metallococcus carri]NHN57422.1 hypothetical protein [Metallococcus carri]NOP39182.1 hypothetical protein [Calidifontibacter sp. DB2511S]